MGLLQKQVAEQIGVDETSVYNWESNRIEPAVWLIPRIHLFLRYSPYTPGRPVSEWLKFARQGLGYSQERMAEALGIDEGTWRRWEAGKRQPSGVYREQIAEFLESLNGAADLRQKSGAAAASSPLSDCGGSRLSGWRP